MNSMDESVGNMVSNLPLLFANGYPTSLDKINESQISNFIPFMVQCSLGNINIPGKEEYSEPEWWPEEIEFLTPLTKPKRFHGDWLKKMQDIVQICYKFHNSMFLLRFCSDLAAYEHERLRFINNFNSTTSLYDRRSNKLLVTFRNENMTYDQPQTNRKCLLQQKSRSQNTQLQNMVEPPLFDIYLCDNCDAELYSLEANMEHEKTCIPVRDDDEDDDVILVPENETSNNIEFNNVPNSTSETTAIRRDSEFKNDFLKNFNLQNRETINSISNNNEAQNQEPSNIVLNKKRKIVSARRNRRIYQLSRCVTIPITSPAGQLLTEKATITDEYVNERLGRIERFCSDKSIVCEDRPGPSSRSKLNKRRGSTNIVCTFKKPQDYPVHIYKFPRRTFYSNNRNEAVQFLNKSLCKSYTRPLSVRLHKITESEINQRRNPNSDLKMKIIRQQGQCNLWEITNKPIKTEKVFDTIDLCSSDDENDSNNSDNNIPGTNSSTLSEENIITETKISDPDTSTSVLKRKYSKKKSKTVVDKLSSEVTLTPIRRKSIAKQNNIEKHMPIKQPPHFDNDSGLSVSNSNSNNSNHFNINNEQKQKIEGNFLLSPHQEIGSTNLPDISKPLQPVFLFSKYKKTNSPLLSLHEQPNEQQENVLDNIILQPNDRTKVLQNLNFMQHYVDSDVTLNKINSPKPKRTISIDLTR